VQQNEVFKQRDLLDLHKKVGYDIPTHYQKEELLRYTKKSKKSMNISKINAKIFSINSKNTLMENSSAVIRESAASGIKRMVIRKFTSRNPINL